MGDICMTDIPSLLYGQFISPTVGLKKSAYGHFNHFDSQFSILVACSWGAALIFAVLTLITSFDGLFC
jgi:hypothetical protein